MTDKGRGILAYLLSWVGGLIVLYGMPDSKKKERIHGAQSIIAGLAFMIAFIITSIIASSMNTITYLYGGGYIPILIFRLIFGGLYVAIIIMGLIKVANEADPNLPLLGKLASIMFLRQINKEPVAVENNNEQAQAAQNQVIQNINNQAAAQNNIMQNQNQYAQGVVNQNIPQQNNVNVATQQPMAGQMQNQNVGVQNQYAPQGMQNIPVQNNQQMPPQQPVQNPDLQANQNNNGIQMQNNYNQTQMPNTENNNINNN